MSKTVIEGGLLDPFKITIESGNYTLSKHWVNEKGNKAQSTIGHYVDFGNAIFEVAKQKAHDNIQGESVDLKKYVNEFKKAQNEISDILK